MIRAVIIALFSALLFDAWSLEERDIVGYLEKVTDRWLLNHNVDPVQCINYGPNEWNLEDPRVNQLVGIVCAHHKHTDQSIQHDQLQSAHQPIEFDPITKACSLFERVAGHYLARIHSGLSKNLTTRRNMIKFKAPYPSDRNPLMKIRYDQVREIFPIICGKLITGRDLPHLPVGTATKARESCLVLRAQADEFLSVLQKQWVECNQEFYSREYPGQVISYNLVKTMLTMVCEENDLKHALSCSYFDGHTRMILQLPNNETHFTLPELRSFIGHICNVEGNIRPYIQVACNDLLKHNMELLMEPVDHEGNRQEVIVIDK